jgi:hypothetical protein
VFADPFRFEVMLPALERALAEGWVIVGTDYPGLGTKGPHPLLIGEGEARAVLDAFRAARRFLPVDLSSQVILWGYSQGGHAVLWAGGIASRYASDVNVVGVAAVAPATMLVQMVHGTQNSALGKVMASLAVTAYSETYPDVFLEEYVRKEARLIVGDIASRCVVPPGGFLSLIEARLIWGSMFARDPTSGPLARRLHQNTPHLPIPAPLFIGQGTTDGLVPAAIQAAFVEQRCKAGQSLEYRTYQGRHHLGVVASDSELHEDLVTWTKARFAGAQLSAGCRTVVR